MAKEKKCKYFHIYVDGVKAHSTVSMGTKKEELAMFKAKYPKKKVTVMEVEEGGWM